MNKDLITLQAKLDKAKSRNNINIDIQTLQNQLDHLKLQAELDPRAVARLSRTIEKALDKKITISNVKVDSGPATKDADLIGEKLAGAFTNPPKTPKEALGKIAETAISMVVNEVAEAIDMYANRVSIAKEALEEFHTESTESKNEIDSQKEWIKNNGELYEKLAKGVDNFGNNISLSTDELSNYHSLTKEIADLFPNMVQGFDSQNNAIIKNKGNVEELTKAYKENADAHYATLRADSGEAFEKYKTAIEDDRKDVKKLDELINNKRHFSFPDIKNYASEYDEILDEQTIDLLVKEIQEVDRRDSENYVTFKFSDFSPELQQKILDKYTELQNTIDSETEKIRPGLEAFLYGSSSGYDELDQESKEAVQSFVKNIDDSFLSQFDDDVDLHSWIKNNVIQPIQDGANSSDLAIRFQTLFSLDQEDYDSYQAYVNAAMGIIDALSKMEDKDGKKLFSKEQIDSFKKQVGVSGYDETGKTVGQDLINNTQKKFKGVKGSRELIGHLSEKELDILNTMDTTKDTSVQQMRSYIDERLKEQAGKSSNKDTAPKTFSQVWNSIDKSEDENTRKAKEEMLELAETGRLTEEKLKNSSLADIFKDAGISIEEATRKINKFKSASDQLSSMKKGMSAITGALDEKQKNYSVKKTRKIGVSPETLEGFDAEIKGLDSWKEFEKTLGNGESSMDDCRDAASKLATEWINSNNFLSQLDETNKDYYISALKNMGVENAEAIVTQMVAEKNKEEADAKNIASIQNDALAITKNGVTDASINQLNALYDEASASKTVEYAIADLIAKENILSNNDLGFDSKITQLEQLAGEYFGAAAAADFMSQVQTSANGALYGGGTVNPEQAWENISKKYQKIKNRSKKNSKTTGAKLATSPSSPSSPSSPPSSPRQKTKKEPKQEINWIDRKINILNNKLSETQKLYDAIAASMKEADSSSMVRKENANLNKQIRILKKLRSSYAKQEKKYQSKADNYVKENFKGKKNKTLRSNIKNGKIKGTYSQLVKEYGQEKANKIQKAIDLYDKASTARQGKADAAKQINDAEIQKHQNRADLAQSRIDKSTARAELKSTTGKNKYIDNEIKHTKNLYHHKIKIAEKNGDSEEAAKLKAEWEKTDRDLKIEKHQNKADLAQSRIDKNAARAELVHLSKKNKYIDQEIKRTKEVYDEKIEIAKLNGDSEEVAKLEAERTKEIRDLEIDKLQNLADEGEESYTLYKTQASMTTNFKDRNKLAKGVTDSLKKQYSNLIKIADKEGDIAEKNRLQLELQQKLNEESKERIQNVPEDYENRLIGNSRQMQVWNNAASLAEAKGKTINAGFYNQMATVAGQEEKKRKEEVDDAWDTYYEQMRDNPNFINSQEWYDSIQIINDASDAYEQARISAEQYRQKAIEANWSIADSARQAIDCLNDEAETYKTIFGYKDMYDKNGVLTDAGTATFALDVYGIENNIAKIGKYNEEIDKVNKQYKDGDISIEKYKERMQELKDGVMDSTETIYSLRDAMKSLIEEGLNAEMDALNESIDKVKQNLSDASNLREYQKNIEKQTKNIASLERQISAKSGDMSEKGRADLQKLKVQLEDARSELEDTEYDKYIEDQERILDDMAEDFQNYLDAQLDQVDKLLQGIIDSVGGGEVPISETINEVGKTIGVDLSKALSDSMALFAASGKTNAGDVYDNTGNDYNDSANEEYKKGENTPIMNTDDKKGTVEANAKASDPAYQKTSAWLKSKGFSDKDIDIMYGSMNNAQNVFSGIQSAGGNPDAMQIFGEYQKNKVKGEGFSLYSQTDLYKEAKKKEEERQQKMEDRKNDNDAKQKEIARLFATVRKYGEADEYATGTLFNYGSQRFAQEHGKGYNKFLSMDNVKKIDSLVKGLVDVQTGNPLFDTSSGEKTYDAIKKLDEANAYAFSKAVKNRKASSFNPAGFSKGGIVDTSTLSKVAKNNGDDAWVTVKSGEGILNPMDTQNLFALTDSLDNLGNQRLLSTWNLAPRKGAAPSNNVYGGLNIHLDGSDIHDFASFEAAFQNAARKSQKLRNTILDVATSGMTGDANAYMRR